MPPYSPCVVTLLTCHHSLENTIPSDSSVPHTVPSAPTQTPTGLYSCGPLPRSSTLLPRGELITPAFACPQQLSPHRGEALLAWVSRIGQRVGGSGSSVCHSALYSWHLAQDLTPLFMLIKRLLTNEQARTLPFLVNQAWPLRVSQDKASFLFLGATLKYLKSSILVFQLSAG